MAQVLASSSDGILIVDRAGRVLTANAALQRMTALAETDFIGCASDSLPWNIQHSDGSPKPVAKQPIARTLASGSSLTGQAMCFQHPDSTIVYVMVDAVPLTDQTGHVDGAVMTVYDVTEQKALESRLAQLALHDALTGLPNRRHFETRAEQALANARHNGTTVSILYIDLDGFKPINDQLGHAAGDRVLIEIARRLIESVGDAGVVARMGGDEFAILLVGPRASDLTARIEQRITASCSAPHRIDGHTVHVTPSMGIGTLSDPDDRLGDVLHRADAAMYEAKRARRTQRRRCTDVISKNNYWNLFGLHSD